MGKPVFIELDTQRELRFGTNVFIKIEDQLGVSLSALDTDKLSYRQARTLLFVPLHEQDKTLTPELVGNMIDKAGITYCMEKVSEAIKSAIEVEESAKNLKSVV